MKAQRYAITEKGKIPFRDRFPTEIIQTALLHRHFKKGIPGNIRKCAAMVALAEDAGMSLSEFAAYGGMVQKRVVRMPVRDPESPCGVTLLRGIADNDLEKVVKEYDATGDGEAIVVTIKPPSCSQRLATKREYQKRSRSKSQSDRKFNSYAARIPRGGVIPRSYR